jgi:hypothetical protein
VLAGLDAKDAAPELNISSRTFERLLYGQREARDWEIKRLAELTAVPEWFLREGLSAANQSELETVEPALARLEAVAIDLERAAGEILRALTSGQSPRDSSRSVQDG